MPNKLRSHNENKKGQGDKGRNNRMIAKPTQERERERKREREKEKKRERERESKRNRVRETYGNRD